MSPKCQFCQGWHYTWCPVHRAYPYKDEYGYLWLDKSGWYEKEAQPCFMCKLPTHRLDIDFHGYYCGNDDDAIAADLEKLNGYRTTEEDVDA